MEAIILGSRSINQDKFFQKGQQDKYKKHRETLGSITKEKQRIVKEWEKEVESMSSTLRKSKSAAKVFKERQDKDHLKEENMFLLKRIWHVEPSITTFHADKYQFVSGSNWNHHKKKLQQIREENKAIGKKFLVHQLESADFRKKLKQDIKGYIQLRDSIRKFKVDGKEKRAQSEKKGEIRAKAHSNDIRVKGENQEAKPQKLTLIEKQQKATNPELS